MYQCYAEPCVFSFYFAVVLQRQMDPHNLHRCALIMSEPSNSYLISSMCASCAIAT